MELGVESSRGLCRGAAEGDPVASARHIIDFETLRFQPGHHLRHVVGGKAEALAELLGSQKAAIVGRPGHLLIGEEGVEGWIGAQKHGGVIDALGGVGGSAIELGERLRMDVALEPHGLRLIHGHDDAVLRSGKDCGDEKKEGRPNEL